MKMHFFQARRIYDGDNPDYACLVGVAGGRVHYPYDCEGPDCWEQDGPGWLYSLRLFFLLWSVEIGWQTRGVR